MEPETLGSNRCGQAIAGNFDGGFGSAGKGMGDRMQLAAEDEGRAKREEEKGRAVSETSKKPRAAKEGGQQEDAAEEEGRGGGE